MKPEKVNMQIRLAGRTFMLETYPQYEALIRSAVERLDERFKQMRTAYEADDSELLAMLLISEVAEKEKLKHEAEEQRQAWQQEWDKLQEIMKQIDELSKY